MNKMIIDRQKGLLLHLQNYLQNYSSFDRNDLLVRDPASDQKYDANQK